MSKGRRPPGPRDYEVGHGRPPAGARFQPGRSGNPKGRPRKQRSIGAILQQVLSRHVRIIQESGRTRSLSAEEVVLTQLANKAAKGDLRATKLLIDLLDRYGARDGGPVIELRISEDDAKL